MAHRGASAYAPENTFSAYDLAIRLGATGIELDVHETQDGVLVVVHDDTISRTLRGWRSMSEHIAELTWAELADLDAGTWFNETRPDHAREEYATARVVRLDDVFDRYGRDISYFIELKHRPTARTMERSLVESIRRNHLHRTDPPRVMVGTFSRSCLGRIHSLDPDIPLVQLFHADASSVDICAEVHDLPSYCAGVGPCKDAVEESLVEAADRQGLGVYTWTVNDPREMRELVRMGVDGIVTDFPDELDNVLSETVRGAA